KGVRRLPIDPRHGFPIVGNKFNINPGLGLVTLVEPEAAIQVVQAWEKESGLIREDYYATIPSLPISYDAARPILEAMGGPNVPGGWQGGLPLAYHVGPGPAEVHFKIEMD